MSDLRSRIRDVPDFPKQGIVFKDIMPLLQDPEAFRTSTDRIAEQFEDAGVTVVAGVEARGFIFGSVVAQAMGLGFVAFRKPGKLPYETVSETYELEYGTDALEVHRDAFVPTDRVLIVDDLLATGGTVAACCRLVEALGAAVAGCGFVVELSFLEGRAKLAGYDVKSLIVYDAE